MGAMFVVATLDNGSPSVVYIQYVKIYFFCFVKQISSYLNHLVPGFLPTTLHTLLSKCLHSDWQNRLTPLDAMYLLG